MPKKSNIPKVSKKSLVTNLKDLKVKSQDRQLDVILGDINLTDIITIEEASDNGVDRYSRQIKIDFERINSQIDIVWRDALSLSFYIYISFSKTENIDPNNVDLIFDNQRTCFNSPSSRIFLTKAEGNSNYHQVVFNFSNLIRGSVEDLSLDPIGFVSLYPRVKNIPDQVTVDLAGTIISGELPDYSGDKILVCRHDELHVFGALLTLKDQTKIHLGDALNGSRNCFWEYTPVDESGRGGYKREGGSLIENVKVRKELKGIKSKLDSRRNSKS
jgi:hypothetical protein